MGPTRFVVEGDWLRDHYVCERCGTIPRQRAVVEVLNLFRPNWRTLTIHESSPSMRFFAEQARGYSCSFFFDDVPVGKTRKGQRCENLEQLTFDDDIFDVFITQDVLEHVFRPDRALAEIMRVLRPGGLHVFTTPKHQHLPTSVPRCRMVDGRVEHLQEPQYHGSPIGDGRALVTWDFGADLDQLLANWSGYDTSNLVIRDRSRGIDGEYLEVFVTTKDPVNRVRSR